jgi:integrase/recombinase XerD
MTLALPLAEWPAPDRAMWQVLCQKVGPLDDVGPLAHLRPTSRHYLEQAYGRWMGWLSRHDPAARSERPEARATLDRLEGWLESLSGGAPMSQLMLIEATVRVLRVAAPDRDWQVQNRLVARMRAAAGRGSQQRKFGRVLSSQLLLEAGVGHAGPEADAAPDAVEAARRRRDGIMIALLSVMPMRKRAFCSLALGDSLIRPNDELIIVLGPEMTKNGQHWEAPVPEAVAPALRRYIDESRRFLMERGGQRHDWLWVGERGGPIRHRSMDWKFGEVTEKLVGVRVPPHFFRDAAATTLARMAPEQALLIRPLLGHSSFRTTERHYIQAQGIEAGRTYAAVIERLRKGSG